MNSILHRSQLKALSSVTHYAKVQKNKALFTINEALFMTNTSETLFEEAKDIIFNHARVALHFHPDRPCRNGKTVSESLLDEGIYKSQFETHLSAGSVSAYKGGIRYQWEKHLFNNAYNAWGVKEHHRPKYGALDLYLSPDGPSPRFGSCFFLLHPKVSKRSTFTYQDSCTEPYSKGTFIEFDMILASLLSDLFHNCSALGTTNTSVAEFLNFVVENIDKAYPDPSIREASRNLNHYIEAQVHGPVSLENDCSIIVADPSFKNTFFEGILQDISTKYGIELFWHMGFSMSVFDVPKDFRGPTMPSLAKRISRKGILTTEMIGNAVRDLSEHIDTWKEHGSYIDNLQELKLLWHILVKYGNPLRTYQYHEFK